MRTFLLLLLCLSVAGCAVSRVDPLTVPLAYRASSASAGALGTLSCNTIAQLQVTDARTDKTLGTRVQQTGSGKSVNYGYSGSIENYQETLSEALERAVVTMAQSPGFKDALCHCGE